MYIYLSSYNVSLWCGHCFDNQMSLENLPYRRPLSLVLLVWCATGQMKLVSTRSIYHKRYWLIVFVVKVKWLGETRVRPLTIDNSGSKEKITAVKRWAAAQGQLVNPGKPQPYSLSLSLSLNTSSSFYSAYHLLRNTPCLYQIHEELSYWPFTV